MSFPLQGVAGVIAEEAAQVELAIKARLHSVEVRADLLMNAGLSLATVLALVDDANRRGLAVLFTLRHPTHGGKFAGSEADRVAVNEQALAAGASVIDLEWGSEAARDLLPRKLPLLLSHHDFETMPSARELEQLTAAMTAAGPLGIKVVPTASRISDSVRMLEWVANAGDGPARIGFAMGAPGACSRVMAMAYGAPITYASFGESVAPGQVPLAELLDLYRVHELDRDTRVFGIAGDNAFKSLSPALHNPAFAARKMNAVYLSLQTDDFEDLYAVIDRLNIDGLSVTTPFKEQALALADDADQRSRGCGASNTLVVDRSGSTRQVHAYNTDFDGVLVPIRAQFDLDGLRVAVIGNGGAARGAIMALKSGGASPALFYRNAERGSPVAQALQVPGGTLDELDASYDVYLNATTLGTNPTDASPVPANVFARGERQLAFEMIYHNPNTQLLRDATAAGARCVRGGEMLVAQGTTQFELFSGSSAETTELQGYFERAVDSR